DELNILLNMKSIHTTAYQPQTNGGCEHMNGTVANMLSNYVNKKQSNWSQYVKAVCYAYNASVHESTKQSPCKLLLGYEAFLPPDVNLISSRNDTIITGIETIREEVRKQQDKKNAANKKRFDVHHENPNFSPGEEILIRDKTMALDHLNKLAPRWVGPVKITKVLGPALLETDNRLYKRVNISKVKRYH